MPPIFLLIHVTPVACCNGKRSRTPVTTVGRLTTCNRWSTTTNGIVRGQPVETFSFFVSFGPSFFFCGWCLHPPKGPSTGHQPVHTCSPAAFFFSSNSFHFFPQKLCKNYFFVTFICVLFPLAVGAFLKITKSKSWFCCKTSTLTYSWRSVTVTSAAMVKYVFKTFIFS